MSNMISDIKPLNAFGGSYARYAFALYSRSRGTFLTNETSAPGLKELVLNPQSIEQDEPMATTITPTLGGLNVETRGQLMKTTTIAGTVGFLPKPERIGPTQGGATLSKAANAAISGPAPEDLANYSGYKDFLELRNLFRRYAMIKGGEVAPYKDDAKQRNDVVMLYYNTKDNEVWIAEPAGFTMPPRRGLLYTYVIRLTLLAPFTTSEKTDLIDAPNNLDKVLSLVQRVNDALNDINAGISTVQSSLTNLQTSVTALINPLVTTLNLVSQGLAAFTQGLTLPASVTADVCLNAALSVEAVIVQAYAVTQVGQQYSLDANTMGALLQAKEALYSVAAYRELFSQQPSDAQDVYASTRTAHSVLFDKTADVDPTVARGQRYDAVLKGETIFSLAARTLGDARRYIEIIALNNLQPPYFTNDASHRPAGVLGPGDSVLLPSTAAPDDGNGSVVLADNGASPTTSGTMAVLETVDATPAFLFRTEEATPWVVNQWQGFQADLVDSLGNVFSGQVQSSDRFTIRGPLVGASGLTAPITWRIYVPLKQGSTNSAIAGGEQSLGVDFALTPDGGLALDQTGDIAAVSGIDNFNSALDVKIRTEQGALPMHRWFGMVRDIGTKGTPRSVISVAANLVRTLKSDSRVAEVEKVQVDLTKDTLNLSARIRIKFDNLVRTFTRSV